MIQTRFAALFALGCSFGLVSAQDVISAKSGLIHYVEGEVYLGENLLVVKFGEYPEVKVGQHLRTTGEGRAEVLLTPGVFLRLAEGSEIAMRANALTNTRIDLVKGSVLLEAGEVMKEHSIEISVAGNVLEVRKRGLFRIDAGPPARVRTFEGEITVSEADQSFSVKNGREVTLAGVPAPGKFEKDDTDSFHRWAGRRSGYLAAANLSAARSVMDNNLPWRVGGWYFNPYFGMFTYIPMMGARYVNPWNQVYYSPTYASRAPLGPQNSMNMDSMMGMSNRRSIPSGSMGSYGGGGGYQAPAAASPSAAGSSGGARSGGGGASRGGQSGSR